MLTAAGLISLCFSAEPEIISPDVPNYLVSNYQ